MDHQIATARRVGADRARCLRRAGVRVGTGYSSLSHLSRLPISILKIDRHFVSRLLTSARHAALTESVVALGRRLELDVVAEGIEHTDQLLTLEAMGCPYG